MTDTQELRINARGRCGLDQKHDDHIIDRGDGTGWDCPGQASDCGNCDGRKCMNCIFRTVHQTCADDCPSCCGPEAFPSNIVVYCDDCGVIHSGDYLVGEDDDSDTRLSYARNYLAGHGWTITEDEDLCPECGGKP